MQSLEAACEEGEVSPITSCQCDQKSNAINNKTNMVCTHSRSFKKAKLSRTPLPLQPNQDSVPTDAPTPKPQFCIHTKLLELYLEECANDPNPENTGLKRNSNLLEKLVAKERLNTLILNLHPGNKGYSLAFPTTPRTDACANNTADVIETKMWPYEDEELLRYIDNEELPAFFVDLLEPHYGFLFYSGCIVAEVRDYRQAYPACICDIHHVLLKPTLQSILADVNAIVEDKEDWGTEEKHQIESQILLANYPTLCLDPKATIGPTASRINHNRQVLNTYRLKRAARRYSQVLVNRKKKLVPQTHRPGLELFEHISGLRTRAKAGEPASSKLLKKVHEEIRPIPVPVLEPAYLAAPSQGVHINEFKAYPAQRDSGDCLPQPLEEYVLETDMHSKEKDKRRVYHIKLSILQRPSNGEYLGELYLDRDHKKGERNGVACRFSLGTRVHANRYIQQFIEIFTEGGRKSVRMNYGLKEKVSQVQAAQMQNQHTSQVNLAQQHLAQLNQSLQNQSCVAPLVNGAVNAGITLVQQNQTHQNTSVPILQAQLQSNSNMKTASQQATSQEIEISALATSLMNYAEQFEANPKQQQQQKLSSSINSNATMKNILNRPPACNVNSDASAAVVNAINNPTILPQQVQTINQKLLGKQITVSNVPNARVLNHSNLIAVNNNRMSLSELSTHLGQQHQQGHTITLTTVNSGTFTHANYTTVPIKAPSVNQRIVSDGGKSALSALLVGTPAADRPDIIGPNTNSLLLEKLAGASGTSPNPAQSPTHFIQSPKNPIMSPLSSPPPQNANTINVQSLNFAPLQSLSGVQNVQVQLPGFAQPISISLNVSSTGTLQGHPTSLLVSVPVTTGTATSSAVGQQVMSSVGVGTSMATPGGVLTNTGTSNIAQLVTSSVKGLTQQSIRTVGPAGVTLTQGGQPFQLITPLQRPRMQQTGVSPNIATRGLQRTPITIKMATPQANVSQVTNAQKQAQIHQYHQQMCMKQQQELNVPKVRRRSNVSEPQ